MIWQAFTLDQEPVYAGLDRTACGRRELRDYMRIWSNGGRFVQLGATFWQSGSSDLQVRNHAIKTLLDELNGTIEETDMRIFWTREFLARRIDRCYLIAVGARRPEKRTLHLELARYYRKVLSAIAEVPALGLVEAKA